MIGLLQLLSDEGPPAVTQWWLDCCCTTNDWAGAV